MTTMRAMGMLLAAATMAFGATAATATDRQLTVVNATGDTMVRLYATNSGRDDPAEDLLGDRILKPGQSVRVAIGDGSGGCKFDLRAQFSGDKVLARPAVDVCAASTYRYTSN
ncbi:hypothetical protein FM036_32850 [Nostoc sp. HG1]|nr:hypothetical protein [Nostoc sp. HG1]